MYTLAYLGMQNIVIILVIALLIFGPQKVPELARQIGGALRDLKKMSNDVQSAFDLDDHSSYDRYEPPTYEYTPPVSTSYGHEPLDQYGMPAATKHPAIEAGEPSLVAADEHIATELHATPELQTTVEHTADVPALSPTVEEASVAVTHTEVAAVVDTEVSPQAETEITTHTTSADVETKSA
jgi:TatA/E family protein of Tat protein translocase